MKNQPNKIHLNIGTDGVEDFKELREVTWSEDRINDSDLEFISVSFISARIKELENRLDSKLKYGRPSDGINMVWSACIFELKNLIK